MLIMRFKTCPNEQAECSLCSDPSSKPVPARWFLYTNARSSNAVAVCNEHALSMVGMMWAAGDTVLVNGQPCDPPSVFVQQGPS